MFRFVVLLSVIGCALADLPNVGVIGGQRAAPGQFPHQVAIEIQGQQHCGGSIISPTHIVTAAHCVHQMPTHLMVVIAGTVDRKVGGVRIPVAHGIVHSGYNPEASDNDIAIIVLASPLTYSSTIKPIALPAENSQINASHAIVSGFGIEMHGGQPSRYMKYAVLPLLDHATCKQIIPRLTANMICAGELHGQENSCPGDSGGPLIANNQLVGVVSWGYGCGAPGAPAMYVYVGAMRSWIRFTTGV